jgi:hypothetical protein
MKIPGIAWTALVLALTGALGGWFTQYVETPWVPVVVLMLNLLGKAAEIYFATPVSNPVLLSSGKQPGTLRRLLLG